MECICKFDKRRDLGETVQSGAVDLNELLAHGVLPSDLNVSPESFNDIEDPKAIYGRPEDKFDAIQKAKVLNARAKAAEAAVAARNE